MLILLLLSLVCDFFEIRRNFNNTYIFFKNKKIFVNEKNSWKIINENPEKDIAFKMLKPFDKNCKFKEEILVEVEGDIFILDEKKIAESFKEESIEKYLFTGELIILTTIYGELLCYKKDGQLLWRNSTYSYMKKSKIKTNEKYIFIFSDGKFVVLDKRTGHEIFFKSIDFSFHDFFINEETVIFYSLNLLIKFDLKTFEFTKSTNTFELYGKKYKISKDNLINEEGNFYILGSFTLNENCFISYKLKPYNLIEAIYINSEKGVQNFKKESFEIAKMIMDGKDILLLDKDQKKIYGLIEVK